MKKILFWPLLVVGVISAILYNQTAMRRIFVLTTDDGFYVQMTHIREGLAAGLDLSLVHHGRYYVVFPFLWLSEANYPPACEMALLFVFMTPLLVAKIHGQRSLWQTAFVILPYFFSFRSVLGMCGMSYLFLFLYVNRSTGLLIGSVILANLGSGVMIAWLIIALLHFRQVSRRFVIAFAAIGTAVVSISGSLSQKYAYFQEQGLPQRGSFGDESLAFWGPVADGLFANNTILASLDSGNYTRAFAYLATAAVMTYVVVFCARDYIRYRKPLYFFSAGAASVAVEGIAFISFVVPLVWFLLYRHEWDPKVSASLQTVASGVPNEAKAVLR